MLRAGRVRFSHGALRVHESGVVVTGFKNRVIVPKVTTCVAFGALSRERDLFAVCHIFQHDRNRAADNNLPTQYAEDAVEAMGRMLEQRGAVLDGGLGSLFLVGSTDMITASYVVHNIFPALGLPGRGGVVADVGSAAFERKIEFQGGKLFLHKFTVSGLQFSRLI